MGLDGVQGKKKFIRYFLIGETLSHQFQYFILSFTDAQPIEFGLIELKFRGGYVNIFTSESESDPYTQNDNKNSYCPNIQFQRQIPHPKSVFYHFHNEDQCCECKPVDENCFFH